MSDIPSTLFTNQIQVIVRVYMIPEMSTVGVTSYDHTTDL